MNAINEKQMKTFQVQFSDGTYGTIKTIKTVDELLAPTDHPGFGIDGEMLQPPVTVEVIFEIGGPFFRTEC